MADQEDNQTESDLDLAEMERMLFREIQETAAIMGVTATSSDSALAGLTILLPEEVREGTEPEVLILMVRTILEEAVLN